MAFQVQESRNAKHMDLKVLIIFLIVISLMYTGLHIAYVHYQIKKSKSVATNQAELEPFDNSKTSNLTSNNENLILQLTLQEAQIQVPNVPFNYWAENSEMLYSNGTQKCAIFPNIFDIDYNNLYWQMFKSSNGTFYFHNAYYDSRKLNVFGDTVRILAMLDRIEPNITAYCQLWFENETDPAISKVYEYKYIWHKEWGTSPEILQPYLLSCIVPEKQRNRKLISISVVENSCDYATNNLKIVYNKNKKKNDFAVCVKGLDFFDNDLSSRLIEWLELLKILGAGKVFFYQLHIHQNISKVLKYYQDINFVDVTPLTLAGSQPNIPGLQHLYLKYNVLTKRQNEVIPFNDCFYKNMYNYKYIVLLDTDEIIIPKTKFTWQELIKEIKFGNKNSKSADSFNFQNVYFFDDEYHSHGWYKNIPKYMHMIQHVHRSKKYTKPFQFVKSFFDTESVLTLHNHLPISCVNKTCTKFHVRNSIAQLQHYRSDCHWELQEICENIFKKNIVVDKTIWKYKYLLTKNVKNVISKIKV